MKYKTNEFETEEESKIKSIETTLEIIERCALNGTWVLISTPSFPSFWRRMCARLENLRIVNSFRIFIDLQSIDYFTVPPSFLCNYSVRFVLTESNNEDMEGFNDVWANILNGDIINNSENISEHPSLAVSNKKFIEKKVDISATNQMMGDISVINNQEGANKITNVIVPNDISKEEGEIFQEITSALNTEQKALKEDAQVENKPREEIKIEETKEEGHESHHEEQDASSENSVNNEMPSEILQEESKISEKTPAKDDELDHSNSILNIESKSELLDSKELSPTLEQPASDQKVEDQAVIESKPDSPLKEEISRESL